MCPVSCLLCHVWFQMEALTEIFHLGLKMITLNINYSVTKRHRDLWFVANERSHQDLSNGSSDLYGGLIG